MRIRILFAKTAAMRYTSHLDLQRTLERTFRRARVPLAYSQGYNPRPRMNLAAALPLGFTSTGELVDVWLEGEPVLEEVAAAIRSAAPPGIEILQVQRVDPSAPKLPNLVRSAEFIVTLLEPAPDLAERLGALQDAVTLERIRGKKRYDLRPLIDHIERMPEDKEGRTRLGMHLKALPGATGRPDEVLDALGLPPTSAQIHRTKLVLGED